MTTAAPSAVRPAGETSTHALHPDDARTLAAALLEAATVAEARPAVPGHVLLVTRPDGISECGRTRRLFVQAVSEGECQDAPSVLDSVPSTDHLIGEMTREAWSLAGGHDPHAIHDVAEDLDVEDDSAPLGLVGVDSGQVLLVNPCALPLKVLRQITTPNALGYISAVVVGTPGGDGLFPVASIEEDLVVFADQGAEWRSADVPALLAALT